MEPANKIELFPWNAREFGCGLCFILAFSLLYCFQEFVITGWELDGAVIIVALTMIYILITFYLALLCQNRLIPYLILLLFWSMVVLIYLIDSKRRIPDYYSFVCIEFFISAGFIFVLQLRFIAAEKMRLSSERAEKTATNKSLFPVSTKEIGCGVFFLLILCSIDIFQVFYVRNLGLLRGLAFLIYAFQMFVYMNCFMAILCQNRLIPYLVVTSFWTFFALLDYLSPDARQYQTAGIAFLINVGCIFILQFVSDLAERRLRVRQHPAFSQMYES